MSSTCNVTHWLGHFPMGKVASAYQKILCERVLIEIIFLCVAHNRAYNELETSHFQLNCVPFSITVKPRATTALGCYWICCDWYGSASQAGDLIGGVKEWKAGQPITFMLTPPPVHPVAIVAASFTDIIWIAQSTPLMCSAAEAGASHGSHQLSFTAYSILIV